MNRIVKALGVIGLLILGFCYSCSPKMGVADYPEESPPSRVFEKKPDVALVLGGGAFHGIAHVGVLKVLEEAGIPIDLIVGTSSGSLVGVLYADKPYADSLLPLMESTSRKDLFDISIFRSKTGVVSGKRLQEFVVNNVGVSQIEQTRIPFIAVATDIDQGKTVAFSAGPIAPAINASCAIPGFFDPVVMYGTTYIDGGILNNIPVNFAKELGAKYIIAVDIMPLKDSAQYHNYKDVLLRALMVSIRKHGEDNLALADMVISPNLKGIPYMSTKDNHKTYEMGVEAAEASLDQIKKDLNLRGIPYKH